MIRTVWKFVLEPGPLQNVPMPAGAEVIRVATQRSGSAQERPCLWALVDPAAEVEVRQFLVVGTGAEFEATGLQYRGSFSLAGPLEFHVFEATR